MKKFVCLCFISLLSCYSTVMYAGSIIPYPIEFDYSARTDRTSNEKHSLFLAKKFYKQLLSGVVIYNASEWAHEHQSKHQLLEIEKPFPKDNKLKCECGFEIDLSGMRNEIEIKSGKKVLN